MLSQADAAVVARDRDLPGLATLLDDAALHDVMSRAQPGTEFTAVRADYLRYKPGTNCLARLSLRANGVDTFGYAIAYRHDAERKIGLGALGTNGSFGSDSKLAREHIAIYLFPHDRRLPALSKLNDESATRRLLGRIAPSFANDPALHLQTLRYKPERRYVARLSIGDRPAAALKLYTFDAYRAARRAEKTISGMQSNCFARCLGHSNSHAALLFEWVEGAAPLLSLPGSGPTSDQLCSAANTIHRLHSQRSATLPMHSREEFLRQLEGQMVQLQWMFEEQCTTLDSIFRAISNNLQEGAEPKLVSCHGDLHPEQLVGGEAGPVLLDFDRACLAEAASDLGYLWAEWRSRDDHLSVEQRDALFDTWLRAYQSLNGTVDQDRIHAYAAARMVALAGECFRRRRVDWRSVARQRIEQAATILGISSQCASQAPHTTSVTTVIASQRPVRFEAAVAEDHNLGFAAAAIDFETASQVLQCCGSFDGTHTGIELESVRVLRHKPGRRCLIEYAGRSRSTGERIELLGKIDAKSRQQRYFDRQRLLWNSGFHADSADGISVARPWGTVKNWQMWLQQKVPGEIGWHSLKRPTATAVARRVAQGLAKLHRLRLPLERLHQINDELEILKLRLPIAAGRLPSFRARIERLLNECTLLAQSASPARSCPIHRDFYPDQFVTSDDKIVLLDFDLLCLGDPAIDVGNLLAHLMEHSLRCCGRTNEYAGFAEALIHEYRLQMPHVSRYAIELHTLLSLARHIWLCTELPGRQDTSVHVLEACEQYAETILKTRVISRNRITC